MPDKKPEKKENDNLVPTDSKIDSVLPDDWKNIEYNENVLYATDANFLSILDKYKSVLIMYYAPWCGHCTAMKPAYAEAAFNLKDNSSIALAAIDATINVETARNARIESYPTIILYVNGKKSNLYNGGRSSDDITGFLNDPENVNSKKFDDAEWNSNSTGFVLIVTPDNFTNTLSKYKHSLVLFYAPWCAHCKAIKPVYMEIAEYIVNNSISDTAIAAINCDAHAEYCQKYKIIGYPTVFYLQSGKNARQYRSGKKLDDFIVFLQDPDLALTPGRDWENVTDSENIIHVVSEASIKETASNNDHILIFIYTAWCEGCQENKAMIAKSSKILAETTPRVKLMALNAGWYPEVAQPYKIKNFPTYLYMNNKMDRVLEFSRNKNYDGIVAFMSNPDKILPKSDHDPSMMWFNIGSSEYLTHLIQFTFNDFIKKHDKVIVMFFDPECTSEWCIREKQEYADTARVVKLMNYMVEFATLDIRKQKTVMKEQGVPENSTNLVYYENGKKVKTISLFTSHDLILFIRDPEVGFPDYKIGAHERHWSRNDPTKALEVLTTDESKEFFEKNEQVLALFYLPDSVRFVALRPNYISVTKLIKSIHKDFDKRIIAVDVSEEKKLAMKFRLLKFPVVIYIKNGKKIKENLDEFSKEGLYEFFMNPENPITIDKLPVLSHESDWNNVDGKDNIIHLNNNTLSEAFLKYPALLVFYYLPWSEKFHVLKDSFAESASLLKSSNAYTVLAAINLDGNTGIAENYSISETKLIYYFKQQELAVFNLGTHVEDMVKFVMSPLSSPPVEPIAKWPLSPLSKVNHLNEKNITDWLKERESSFVLFYTPTCRVCTFSARDAEAIVKIWPNRIGAYKCIGNNKKFCVQKQIKGYPTFIQFRYEAAVKNFEGRLYQDDILRILNQD